MQPEKKQGSNRGEVGKEQDWEETAKSREGTGEKNHEWCKGGGAGKGQEE